MKRLRYMFDVTMRFFIRGCKYDWMDEHTTFDICHRCENAMARKTRIEAFRTARDERTKQPQPGDFPTARLL